MNPDQLAITAVAVMLAVMVGAGMVAALCVDVARTRRLERQRAQLNAAADELWRVYPGRNTEHNAQAGWPDS